MSTNECLSTRNLYYRLFRGKQHKSEIEITIKIVGFAFRWLCFLFFHFPTIHQIHLKSENSIFDEIILELRENWKILANCCRALNRFARMRIANWVEWAVNDVVLQFSNCFFLCFAIKLIWEIIKIISCLLPRLAFANKKFQFSSTLRNCCRPWPSCISRPLVCRSEN